MLPQGARKTIVLGLVSVYLAACAILLANLKLDANLSLAMADDTEYKRMLEAEALLPQPEPLVIVQPCNGSPFTSGSLDALATLVAALEERAAKAGAQGWTVRSILGESIPITENGGVSFQSLGAYANNGQALGQAMAQFPTLGRLFCPSGDTWILYAYPLDSPDALIQSLHRMRSLFPDIAVSGHAWLQAQSIELLRRDLIVVVPIALLAILLVFLVYERAGLRSIVLAFASFLPAIGTIALYPLFGYPLRVSTILAPLLVLALSTTYVVHAHHHFKAGNRTLLSFYRERGKAIFWSGITTLLGFSSLALSPIDDIRTNGLFIVLGMILAFMWDLGFLPWYLSNAVINATRVQPALEKKPGSINTVYAKHWRVGVLIILLAASSGIARLQISTLPRDDFIIGSQAFDRDVERFKNYLPLTNEILMYVDTGFGGGIVDPDFYARSRACASDVQSIPGVRSVYAYTDIVDELAKALEYPSSALDSDTGIGELLELIPIDADSPRLYDLSYRLAVFRIGIDADARSIGLSTNRTKDIHTTFGDYFTDSEITLAGSWPRMEMSLLGLAKGQLKGLILYFAIVLALLAVFFKSPLKSLAICASPALAILASLGFCGYAGWDLTPTLSIAVASIAGVGIDDAILWGSYSNRPGIRRSIIGTTVLLACGLAPLLLSYHLELIRGVIAVMIGLVLSTTIVLKVLPWK